MEAKDLSIGNLVERDGNILEVIRIAKDGVINYDLVKESKGMHVNSGIVIPIPLTEEWHDKFGIKKNGFNSFEYKLPNKLNLYLTVIFTGDYVMIRQGKKKSIDDDMISIWNKDLIKRDMFVHEWQNLYFALTSEELIIKN
jgi:hypothetical protein